MKYFDLILVAVAFLCMFIGLIALPFLFMVGLSLILFGLVRVVVLDEICKNNKLIEDEN